MKNEKTKTTYVIKGIVTPESTVKAMMEASQTTLIVSTETAEIKQMNWISKDSEIIKKHIEYEQD